MSNDNSGATVITGREAMTHFHWLQVRRALKLEIETGMRFSNRGSVRDVANRITGSTATNKRKAYAALNAKIVAEVPGMKDVPLKPAR